NYSLAEFLRSAPDSAADQRKFDRLREQAESGDETSRRALAYARTRRSKELQGLELDELLDALSPASTRRQSAIEDSANKQVPGVRRRLDIYEFLDLGVAENSRILSQLE